MLGLSIAVTCFSFSCYASEVTSTEKNPQFVLLTQWEYQMLKNNLEELSAINKKHQELLNNSTKESEVSKKELIELKNQLEELEKLTKSLLSRNKEQENLLANANKSLKEQEIAYNKEKKSLTNQRNKAIGLAVLALGIAVGKK